jgi:predicted RNase H-like nuclease (RuvC/YqgF family)
MSSNKNEQCYNDFVSKIIIVIEGKKVHLSNIHKEILDGNSNFVLVDRKEFEDLKARVEFLEKENVELRRENAELRKQVLELQRENAELRKQVLELQRENAEYANKYLNCKEKTLSYANKSLHCKMFAISTSICTVPYQLINF